MLKQIANQGSTILERFRLSLKPLFEPELLRGFNRAFLPLNLGAYADEISKRNCVQVLMLVTSLIGYADQLMSSASRTSA